MKRVIDLIKVRQPTLNEPLISLTYNRSRLSFFVSHNYNNKKPQKSSNIGCISNYLFHKFFIYPPQLYPKPYPYDRFVFQLDEYRLPIVFIPLNNIFSWCFLFDRWFLVITFHVWNSFHIFMKYGIMNVYVCL